MIASHFLDNSTNLILWLEPQPSSLRSQFFFSVTEIVFYLCDIILDAAVTSLKDIKF